MNHLASDPAERRLSHRLAIHDHARVKMMLHGDGVADERIDSVTLTDISREGLMAADAGQLLPGTRVLLEVPLIGWREAEVMWIADNRAGCRFDAPLSLEDLRLAAAGSERLAQETPAFAAAVAALHVAGEIAAAKAAAAKRNSTAGWPSMLLLVTGLGVASFVTTILLLTHFGL